MLTTQKNDLAVPAHVKIETAQKREEMKKDREENYTGWDHFQISHSAGNSIVNK